MVAGPEVDLVLKRGEKWPLQDERYDVLLSTQVIEHVDDLEFLVKEMSRVLKSDGVIILSFPFIYNVHGEPHDYRRLTTYGAKELLSDFEIVHMEAQGGIGSTLVVLFLNWLNAELSLSGIGKLVKGIILPLFIPASLVLNLLGLVLDQLDHTNIFYSGIILIARKR
jgi:SAM-dependent methyltransferase